MKKERPYFIKTLKSKVVEKELKKSNFCYSDDLICVENTFKKRFNLIPKSYI
jgi:hypothetical protein